jgi:uncharacterized membrane protein YedE/YeeE
MSEFPGDSPRDAMRAIGRERTRRELSRRELSRRELLAGAAGAVGGALLAGLPVAASAAQNPVVDVTAVPADPTKVQGAPTSAVGARSRFVAPARTPTGEVTGNSLTPLQDLTYVVGVLVGGLVFGVGFGLGGYCPGTCVVGASEGRRDAWWAILGGVVGALAFTLAYTTIVAPMNKLADYGKVTLADVLHLPAVAIAVALFAVFVAVVAWLPTVRGGGSE